MDWDTIGSFLRHGIHHVLSGWDHLLFASALVLALTGFWEVFKIIGVFTVAHSITVTIIAVRGQTILPPQIVEPVIGGSIVFVALENILRRNSALTAQRMAIVFVLGLVHGMGFGGALLENLTGIQHQTAGWCIASFCVGVEVGHLCVVAPLSGFLKIIRDAGGEGFRAGTLKWGSAVIALGGCYYFITALMNSIAAWRQGAS